ncbi:MAG: LytTR family DNA-binding domain-containing protein [Bacteroidia bacterium]|nr:LytTR family DNA-binding domain-containing protein [Bacteroidia bacterium]
MNILIIEDEIKTARFLKELLEEHEDCIVVGICESITEGIAYLNKNQAKLDLIFSDIQLSDGNVFALFQAIRITKPVVFCTAYNQYFLDAFKNNGIDYILKPFEQKDIDDTLQKVRSLRMAFNTANINYELLHLPVTQKHYQTSFIVQFREKMIPVLVSDIALFFLENERVYVLRKNGEQSLVFKTLDEVEQSTDPVQFFRINRQMIVNRTAIKEIEPYFNRKVTVNLSPKFSEKLVVSRLKVSAFKQWIEKPE